MDRPVWHFRPEKNWINDPNGLCQVDGVYHMFYQYNPHGDQWGDIHWGHATSVDLIHWQEQGIAMAPLESAGECHCFSGGCCKDENGRPHFFYTSIGREEENRGARYHAQQWFAEPADAAMTRLVQSPEGALTGDIHGGMQVLEWRDPCVIRHGEQYLMVLGGMAEDRGCALLYTSPDMKQWTYRHILAQSDKADGVCWECPNLIEVDGHFVLLYSPCAQVMAKVGDLDEALHFHELSEEVLEPADWQGYYAPQCFTDEQGRKILIGWMPECDNRRKGWSGVMSLPRLMKVRDGWLWLEPMGEIMGLPNARDEENVRGAADIGADTHAAMAAVYFTPESLPLTLRVLCSPDGEEQTVYTLTREGMLTCDRSRSSLAEEPKKDFMQRSVPILEEDNELFAIIDHSAVEVMVNGRWLSVRAYPTREDSTGIRVEAAGEVDTEVFW